MAPEDTITVHEAAERLGTTEQRARSAAARVGVELFRGEFRITEDELARMAVELGIDPENEDDESDDDEVEDESGEEDSEEELEEEEEDDETEEEEENDEEY